MKRPMKENNDVNNFGLHDVMLVNVNIYTFTCL